ncbi:hypothetical protein [Pseudovibrio sp. Tun.PSC04-5.I4]|uniref:hypothetical protein n=1 Tax=Pseudovibrio sp. Tun.PSC04-5.I4 TaxID=1798213 RepID=UPI00087FE1D0|nr:hypothetical protein [Pseudovibrio sp. Tun.PSC04-5.I4]SDR09800.1 hypothetical protein SAMN04515695_2749 [Pseudovibrio sp. Tun.PSC04-5.I4]
MNSIDNDVFSDRCNVPLFLFSEAMKLAVLVVLGIGLLHFAPALDDELNQAKLQSILSNFIAVQVTTFEAQTNH